MVVGYPYAQAGTGGSASELMFGSSLNLTQNARRGNHITEIATNVLNIIAAKKLAPFTKSNTVSIMRADKVNLRGAWGHHEAREQILPLVVGMNIDVVALAWGPYGKALTADIACRGIQAIDVGRLQKNI